MEYEKTVKLPKDRVNLFNHLLHDNIKADAKDAIEGSVAIVCATFDNNYKAILSLDGINSDTENSTCVEAMLVNPDNYPAVELSPSLEILDTFRFEDEGDVYILTVIPA